MYLTDDMRDLLRLFQQHKVRYAVCGGFAVAFHGFTRMTLDLDLLIEPSADNALGVRQALEEFGFGAAGIDWGTLTQANTAITLGEPPNQVDLLTRMSSTPVEDILQRAVPTDWDGVPVYMVSRCDLLAAKQEAGRPKDRLDLEELGG